MKKINLGTNINTKFDDYVPSLSADGNTLYFVRNDHPDNPEPKDKNSIWVSNKNKKGEWQLAQVLGSPLNNTGSNSVVSISSDENTLILNNTYNEDGSPKGPGLSVSSKLENGWQIPKDVVIDNYYNHNRYVNYAFSSDLNYLISAIEREDTRGDLDLYISFKKGDSYSEPVNLGDKLNTFGSEITPFIAPDNKTLFFSSNGIPGYGSNDIFVTRRLDDTWLNWSEPLNLGKGINSWRWEAYYKISSDGEYAYMVHTAEDGSSDIIKLKQPNSLKPEPILFVKGRILNAVTKEPIAAQLEYSDISDPSNSGRANSNPQTGEFKLLLQKGKYYAFNAIQESYFPQSENLDLRDINEYKEIIKTFIYILLKKVLQLD